MKKITFGGLLVIGFIHLFPLPTSSRGKHVGHSIQDNTCQQTLSNIVKFLLATCHRMHIPQRP